MHRLAGPTGLTAKRLGAFLREYDIVSGNIRFTDGSQAKGYVRSDFADAWSRYCPVPAESAPLAEGVSVPSVPSSSSQVSAGRIETLGRMIRPSKSIRPSLTSRNDLGTDGTDTPPLRLVGSEE